jgi:hypothetical protein
MISGKAPAHLLFRHESPTADGMGQLSLLRDAHIPVSFLSERMYAPQKSCDGYTHSPYYSMFPRFVQLPESAAVGRADPVLQLRGGYGKMNLKNARCT